MNSIKNWISKSQGNFNNYYNLNIFKRLAAVNIYKLYMSLVKYSSNSVLKFIVSLFDHASFTSALSQRLFL